MSTSLSVTHRPLNKQFLVLQAIAIILVVLGHKTGSCVNLLKFWFPIYSYHMPLFIFISGYFYSAKSEQNIPLYIWKKIKRLVLPYFCWNLVYGVIYSTMCYYGFFIGNDGSETLSLHSLFIMPWTTGGQYEFNLATWFVLSLFLVQIAFVIMRKVAQLLRIYNEILFFILTLIGGVVGTYLGNVAFGNHDLDYLRPLVKMLFLLPFFNWGFLYKTKIEYFDTLNSTAYFSVLFVLQFILIEWFGLNNLGFDTSRIFFNGHCILPFITSFTGIALWLRIARILSKSIGDNGVVRYIGGHTWDIMTHHIFVFFLFNMIFYFLVVSGLDNTNSFNFHDFQTNVWYCYRPFGWSNHFYLLPCVLGVTVPLLARKFISHTPLAKIRKFFLR